MGKNEHPNKGERNFAKFCIARPKTMNEEDGEREKKKCLATQRQRKRFWEYEMNTAFENNKRNELLFWTVYSVESP